MHFYIKRNDDRENFTLAGAAIIYLKQVDVFNVIRFPSEITNITVQIYFIKVWGIDTSAASAAAEWGSAAGAPLVVAAA